MRILGVDENGLGPRLGPLVATLAAVEVKRYDAPSLIAEATKLGIGDSKAVSAFGKMAAPESLALAVVEALQGQAPKDADGLFSTLVLGGTPELKALCPDDNHQAQCFGALPLPAFGGSVEMGRDMLEGLDKAGVKIVAMTSTVACAERIHRAKDAGLNKLGLDLDLFERLLLDDRKRSKRNVMAYCGMVGGIRDYKGRFQRFESKKISSLVAEKHQRSYRIKGFGEVSFEVKADARHAPVALASMVGKYVREIWMHRQNSFYTGLSDSIRPASGYHDPVTAQFVQSTMIHRRRLKIVDRCFER